MNSDTPTPKTYISYADMLKKPLQIEVQPQMPAKTEKLVTLKKKTTQN